MVVVGRQLLQTAQHRMSLAGRVAYHRLSGLAVDEVGAEASATVAWRLTLP